MRRGSCRSREPIRMERILSSSPPSPNNEITLFFCGDVMTGRGIDQILPHPGSPEIFEPYMKSARGYVEIAEQAGAAIPKPVDFAYIWGDALGELRRIRPDAAIVNLETSITQSDDYWNGKAIQYRMHPDNVACLETAGIDCCCLANNHVLDWGYAGLAETLETLQRAGIRTAGAGRNRDEAQRPAVLEASPNRRVVVYNCGCPSSGVPSSWAASEDRPGINFCNEVPSREIPRIEQAIDRVRQEGDLVFFSIHWGGNWGYEVEKQQIEFAHQLIDRGIADIVCGHSSHHVKAAEIYRGKPVFYGCGDFLTDYEGIGGHEEYRGDLGLMYFATVELPSAKLRAMQMIPTRVENFRVRYASRPEAKQLKQMLQKGLPEAVQVDQTADNRLVLRTGRHHGSRK